jgi:hypothetical protein
VRVGLPAQEDSLKKEGGKVDGWKMMALLLVLAVAGCGVKERSVPGLVVTCPDPAERATLGDGATYRDLAESRAEAVSGWRQCHDALAIAQE